jgi:hypothetical protein
MKYALLLTVVFAASAGSAYASPALHVGMRPEIDAVPFSGQARAESFEALSSAADTSATRHSVEFAHTGSDSSALRSGMRPE